MQKKTITLNGNFSSPVNVNSSLNVDGDVNVNGELIINNKSIDETLNNRIEPIENLHLSSEYTACEVFPTTEVIPAGTLSETMVYGALWKPSTAYAVDSYVLLPNQKKIYTCIKAVAKTTSIEPGVTEGWQEYWVEGCEYFNNFYYEYTEEVPANNTITIKMYANVKNITDAKQRKNCDIVIDWGDGTISKVADTDDTTFSCSDYFINYGHENDYAMISATHTYKDCVSRIENGKIVESKKYIIKVYGNDYFMIRFGGEPNSIVSRICESDLPISSNVTNISSGASQSLRLLFVHVPYQYNFRNVTNFASLLYLCNNLKCIYINSNTTFNFGNLFSAQSFANGAVNLTYANAPISPNMYYYAQGYRFLYYNCNNLKADVLNLLPQNGFIHPMNMQETFRNCKKLYCSNYERLARMLWDNPNITFTDISGCFKGCSDELRSHVPVDWGGTKA